MSRSVTAGAATQADAQPGVPLVANRYGHFSADGREYVVTDPRTPRPWVNIISNPRFGLAVSQTGSGFTWIDNSQLAVLTRWHQELSHDSSGKFLYVHDDDTGDIWSLSPAPCRREYDRYECRHGIGYSTFVTEFSGVRAEWTLFCHATRTAELWRVRLSNLTDHARRLRLVCYLEWCCGVAPSPRREFHKLFLETEFDADTGAVLARNRMWDVQSESRGHWNTDFPYVSALAGTEAVQSVLGDKIAFAGLYNDLKRPEALSRRRWEPRMGRHEDPVAALRYAVELPPRGHYDAGFALVADVCREKVLETLEAVRDVEVIDQALEEVRQGWRDRLGRLRVETPDAATNYLMNDWLRYQAISGRIWGRCGYYQQSGAFGFRDQLQDSQVWLGEDASKCGEQILLHAAHQLADGSVYHWWHPASEQGLVTRITDDLLWLAFVTANYLKETGDFNILDKKAAFVDDETPTSLLDHIERAFQRVFDRTSPRGLPYIGAGDWNDGLSAVGTAERGESIWLGHFLAGLLSDWAEVFRRTDAPERAGDFERRRAALVEAINAHGWDGDWYIRATLDDGQKIGSSENRVGRIFLNAQTWALLSDVAPPDRAKRCLRAVREHLVCPAGALLLAPAYDTPDEKIGYITRYAPGSRENGGVYMHAACWAIAAACKAGDADLAATLLDAANPTGKDPETYLVEPYVTPGHVEGPDSPYCGRGGWTWYTGSAAWLHRVVTQWVLGVRPEWDGLRMAPCLPRRWDRASMVRSFRGASYEIDIERDDALPGEAPVKVTLDGKTLPDAVVRPDPNPGRTHQVVVRFRDARAG